MQKAIVRYIGAGGEVGPDNLVVIHPADQMRAQRDLFGKEWVSEDYRMYYVTWLAVRRGKDTELDFDGWLETVAEVEPLLSEEQIQLRLAAGLITPEVAAIWRRESEAAGSGRGESARKRIASQGSP